MKAKIQNITIDDVKIIGKWCGVGLMVEWTCPASNVDARQLLGINHAGFEFHISGDVCRIISRLPYTEFIED